MGYLEHKEHFNIAYKTGADTWTHPSTTFEGKKFIEKLSPGANILDVGSGRGFFAKHLADLGFKVIGIDFAKEVVEKANENIADWGLEGKLKFVEGDVLSIPFVDAGFDAVCDFGLFETLYKEDWPIYAKEINRVLKPGGIYLNVSLSRETHHFFEFSPKAGVDVDFEKYGIHYHFFGEEEMKTIFLDKFETISQKTELAKTDGKIVLLETLFRKK
ncbi:MAG: class I SAM-dependent methyltransferase [Candidatus Paceibacterota bacterium]